MEEKNIGSTPLLEVNDLSISFENQGVITNAVKGISYQLNRGEILGVVGESGSGKSVSSMALIKLLPSPPASYEGGTIFLEGNRENLLSISEKSIRAIRGKEISIVFQEPMTSLNPSMRCGKQVAEMLILHQKMHKAEAKALVLKLFENVRIPDPQRAYEAYPHQLSGGQLQRVMIAMAISCKPKILIADEPTTALDVSVQKSILELLKNLNQENENGTIFITHDLGVIKDVADKIMVMYQGEVVEYGTVSDVFTNPKHPYTKGLIACRPPMDRRYHRLPTVSDFLSREETLHTDFVNTLIQSPADYQLRLSKVAQKPILLEVNNLSKYYTNTSGFFKRKANVVRAVDDVSFTIRRGECVGLVGESGCGKSTLGKTIMRLEQATSGEIIFDGENLLKLEGETLRKKRKDFQIIFQDPYSSLNPRMTVGDAISEPLSIHKPEWSKSVRKEKVMSLLEKVGLGSDVYSRYPHQFSGGQRQRVCIARAIGMQPKLIICDESVSALDVSVQAQVLNLLKDLQEEFELSYLFITHDLSVVKFISDEILVMQQGKIVESGDPESVIHHPQQDYTRMLIDAVPG